MLTSIYYYGLYKPYIIGVRETGGFAPKRARIADRRQAAQPAPGQTYVLNKSVKDEIVQYAHDVSYGVTNLRSSARSAARDMENFNRNAYRDGWDEAVDLLTDDLSGFAKHYNQAAGFMQTQEQSPNLRAFSYEVADNVYYNRARLGLLGLSLTEDGRLNFDRKTVRDMTPERVNIAIGENIKIFGDLQRGADRVLTEPLVDHMRFKALGYHYNYKMGQMETDGFGLLEAGLLVDKFV